MMSSVCFSFRQDFFYETIEPDLLTHTTRKASLVISLFHQFIHCLSTGTTVTSARIPVADACYCSLNLCVFSHVQTGTPGLTHKGCILQRVHLGALSDVMAVLVMRQSLHPVFKLYKYKNQGS